MLVIDEIHSILAGTFREQRIVLNAIRFLANDLRIPLVCVGTHEARQALMTDQQLADRFEAWELPPWQDNSALHQLLASFAAILPLRRASELHDGKIRKRVLVLTEGVMVRICRLLEAAAIHWIRSEWAFVFQTYCARHRAPLVERWAVCFVKDPLLATANAAAVIAFCWKCGSAALIRS